MSFRKTNVAQRKIGIDAHAGFQCADRGRMIARYGSQPAQCVVSEVIPLIDGNPFAGICNALPQDFIAVIDPFIDQ